MQFLCGHRFGFQGDSGKQIDKFAFSKWFGEEFVEIRFECALPYFRGCVTRHRNDVRWVVDFCPYHLDNIESIVPWHS